MKKIFTILLVLPLHVNASELLIEIERKSAELSSCTTEQPCEITVEKSNNKYIAKVKRSVKITKYGVLKYKTGSITYHVFDEKGAYIKTKHTT